LHDDKLALDKERRELRERELEGKQRLEEQEYQNKELMHKLSHLNLNLEARNRECDQFQKELSTAKR
jgi:predicted nuclease with TOPRIM domain